MVARAHDARQSVANHASLGKLDLTPFRHDLIAELIRRCSLPAQHPCTQPCHAPSICPEAEPCTAAVTVSCPCGRIQQSVLCGRSASSPAGREAALVPRCTNECEIAKRNARLAEALGINPDSHKANSRQVMYSDDLVTFTKPNVKFVELVEKTLAEYVFLRQ
jgi:transcriptional repressor NF-X1